MDPVERHRRRQADRAREEAAHKRQKELEWTKKHNALARSLGKKYRVEQIPNKLFARIPKAR